jgi:hypothetical protein
MPASTAVAINTGSDPNTERTPTRWCLRLPPGGFTLCLSGQASDFRRNTRPSDEVHAQRIQLPTGSKPRLESTASAPPDGVIVPIPVVLDAIRDSLVLP